MYSRLLLILSCLSLQLAAGAPAPNIERDSGVVEPRGTVYSSTSGRLFNIAGKTQYFSGQSCSHHPVQNLLIYLGTNAWYLGHLTSNDDINQAMSQIAAVFAEPIPSAVHG